MNEKQKAKELIEKFIDLLPYSNRVYETAKQCALICVDENVSLLIKTYPRAEYEESFLGYWDKVKTEIQNYEP